MLPIATSRLLIRPLLPADAVAVFAYRSLDDITKYQMWKPSDISEVRRFILEQRGLIPGLPGSWYQMAILLQDSGELIGDCGILVSMGETGAAELGITLTRDAQGKGFAAEALSALIDYCFSTLHMTRILARVYQHNASAITLVERLGFSFAGRVASKLDGETDSDLFYTLQRRSRETRTAEAE
jgi:RimJ/RimL family protein N-acetyltransferase